MSIANTNINNINSGHMMQHHSVDSTYQLHRGFSTSSEQLSINPNNSSPTHLSGSAIPRHHSEHSGSPLNLSSVLNTLSIGTSTQPQTPLIGSFVIRLTNLPKDVTLREAYALFALAHGVLSIDMVSTDENQPSIVAKFESQHLACQYASIMNVRSHIFGPMYPFKINVEVIDELTNQQMFFQTNSPQIQPQMGASSFQLPSSGGVQSSTGPNLASPPQSASRKRPSLLGQRSRFSFSDPFSSDSAQLPPSKGTTQTSIPNLDAGKSFLLMEGDGINDNIWGSNSTIPSAVGGISSNSYAQQGSVVDWSNANASNPRKQSSSVFGGGQQQSATPTNIVSTTPSNNTLGQVPTSGVEAASKTNVNQQLNGKPPASLSSKPVTPTSSQTPHKSGSRSNLSNSSSMTNIASSSNTQSQTPARSVASVLQNTPGISQVDLSLLARVPPPANPADQNPPCNTLYVGNLPPDATEQELRQLFGGQKGFRRLSFRNKNNNNSGHGPMCFVEFEDVAHATRALAELYGSQLPRPVGTHNNKGGIRLSFSKNPLGVRGPNSRRSGSSGSPQPQGASSSNTNNLNNNSTASTSATNGYSYVNAFSK